LKKPPAPGARRRVAIVLGFLAVSLLLLSAPWRGEGGLAPGASPRTETAFRCAPGALAAGAAFVPFDLPSGAPIGGFPRWDFASTGVEPGVGARALTFSSGAGGAGGAAGGGAAPGGAACRVVLVAADLVLVPDALVARVRAELGPDAPSGLVVVATHTHAGPGGYWDHLLGERFGTGPYDPRLEAEIVRAIARAVREAAAAEVPARVLHGAARLPEHARNRAGTEVVDGHLDLVRVVAREGTGTGAAGDAGATIGEVVVFPAHPTLLGRRNRVVSGDWPGALAARAGGTVRLVLQGAGGDQSATLPGGARVAPEPYADALAGALAGLAPAEPGDAALAFATAVAPLPHAAPGAVPGLLRRAAGTLLGPLVPEEARVSVVALGPLRLVAVPGEPVARVGDALRAAAGPGAVVVGLAGGYCGYVEVPEAYDPRAGETRRQYYGPALSGHVVRAASEAARAVEAPRLLP
jgi:hypothetical protein